MHNQQKLYKGLGVYRFNWVTKNKLSIETQTMSTNYLASGIKIDEKVFKYLKNLYKFEIINNKLVYDPKTENIIGKKYRTQLSSQPIYVLSKQWMKQELYRTNSPMLKKFIADNVQASDILPDYKEHLHQKHLDDIKYWHLKTSFHMMEGEPNEFDEIEQSDT